MMTQKRADQIAVGDVLYASDRNSTGTVRFVSIRFGQIHIMTSHFDREVPTHTLLDVETTASTQRDMSIYYSPEREELEGKIYDIFE